MLLRGKQPSSAPVVACLYGFGGVVWILANLLLARQMDPHQYAWVALFLAITQTAGYIGPLGADGLARRQQLPLLPSPLPRVLGTSGLVGLLAAAIGSVIYGIPHRLILIVPATAIAIAVGSVATSELQGRGKLVRALVVMQGQSFALLLAAGATAFGLESAWGAMLIYAVGCGVLATWGWSLVAAAPRNGTGTEPTWNGAGPLLLIHGAGLVMLQLERFIIPLAVSLEALATFSVLAATASTPFRLLQLALSFVLVPELRQAKSSAERRSILRKEAGVAAAAAIAAAVGVGLLVPEFVERFLHGKYHLSGALIAAAILVGCWRTASVLVTSVVYALGDYKQLVKLGLITWLAVGAAAVSGAALGHFGLTAVVWGVGLGAVVLGIGASPMARSCFRQSTNYAGGAAPGQSEFPVDRLTDLS